MSASAKPVNKSSSVLKLIESEEPINKIIVEFSKLSKNDADSVVDKVCELYYHDTPIMSDDDYDLLEKTYEGKFGARKKIGSKPPVITRTNRATVNEGAKVRLPFFMGGLDKSKDDHSLGLWLKRQDKKCIDFVLEDKEDGVSGLLDTRNLKELKLYKRGDETDGSDISHLIPYINLPVINKKIAVRGELVVPVRSFENKYKEDFKNPRNFVSGLTNPFAKTMDTGKLSDVDFVAYEILYYENTESLKPSEQNELLTSLGFKTPKMVTVKSQDITADNMTIEVKARKKSSPYELDGIVIKADIITPLTKSGNPDHMIAFKISGDVAQTEVINVEWAISKHGTYKPTVIVKMVNLSGVNIQRATGFNGKFIQDNGIGPGAIILITRSNDVIPYILDVIKKAEPLFPDGDWLWNDNEVEIILPPDTDNEEMKIAKIVSFFKEMGGKFLGEQTVIKLYQGGLDSLAKIMNATVSDILDINGFQLKSAEKTYDSIYNCTKGENGNGVKLYKVMAASSIFPGMGSKRLELIISNIPIDIEVGSRFKQSYLDDLEKQICSIKGFKKLANLFTSNLNKFLDWLEDHPKIFIEEESDSESEEEDDDVEDVTDKMKVATIDPLKGQVIVLTGWRAPEDFEKQINKRGGRITTAISGQTTLLVANTLDGSTKLVKAQQMGIKIMKKDEFMAYFI